MRLKALARHWDEFGRRDPLWAILTADEKAGRKWSVEEFLATGCDEITSVMRYCDALGLQFRRGRAVDFGCGAGRLTRPLADHFDQVIGVDIAPSMVDLAQRMHADTPACRFIVNRTQTLDCFEAGSVDFLYSRLVLQHMSPRYARGYLSEFMRILAPNGVAIFQLPAGETPPVEGHGIKTVLPLPLVAAIRAARRAMTFPRMEVHGLPRRQVEVLVERLGGSVVDVVDDRAHGDRTPGFRYCVMKNAATSGTPGSNTSSVRPA